MKNRFALLLIALWGMAVYAAEAQNAFAQTGKIWYDEGYLYVNIVDEGVLVVENYDPKNPKKVGFIQIPGNVDMAVRGTTLYANSDEDLVIFDIMDPKNVREVARMEDVFNHRDLGRSNRQTAWRAGSDFENAWQQALQNLSNSTNGLSLWEALSGVGNLGVNGIAMQNQPTNTGVTSTGKGGSMACFALIGEHLYAIDGQDLHVFNINNSEKPRREGNPTHIGVDIETLFAYEDHLYIGAQSGMHIYGIQNPTLPVRQGHYRHTKSCDPVVVEGDYAYVTLRDGTDCAGKVNQLDVLDISNPRNPRKIKTYDMSHPHGLGIDNGTLFICDGFDGLKVYDASNPNRIAQNRIAHFPRIQTYDVIPVPQKKLLILTGGNRIRQYDYTNPNQIEKLSDFDPFQSEATVQH